MEKDKDKDESQFDPTVEHLLAFKNGDFVNDLAFFEIKNIKVVLETIKSLKNAINNNLKNDLNKYGKLQEAFFDCVIKGRASEHEYISAMPYYLPSIEEYTDDYVPVKMKKYFNKYLIKDAIANKYLRWIDDILKHHANKNIEYCTNLILKFLRKNLVDVSYKKAKEGNIQSISIKSNDLQISTKDFETKRLFYPYEVKEGSIEELARLILTLMLMQIVLKRYLTREINRIVLQSLQDKHPEIYENGTYKYTFLKIGVINLTNSKTINVQVIIDGFYDLYKYQSELKRYHNNKYDYNLYIVIPRGMFNDFGNGKSIKMLTYHHKVEESNNIVLYQKEQRG